MHKPQIGCRWQRGLDAWADARGWLSQDGYELHIWGGGYTAEADDPPVVAMSSRFSHIQSWRPARCPRFRTIIRSPLPKMKKGSAFVPGPRYGNSQQVGSCWGRQGRQAPGQDLKTPTLAAYRDPSSALPLRFCCPWAPLSLRPWQLSPQKKKRETVPSAEWERIVTTDQRHSP